MNRLRQHLSDAKTVLYRNPRAQWAHLRRWGPWAYFRCDAWAREMEAAVWKLPIPTPSASAVYLPLSVWFLTGKRYWYQTAFCAWTLARHSERELMLNLVDDGTLEDCQLDELRRLFPRGIVLNRDVVQDRIEALLPAAGFPVLRKRWLDYVHIRKLTDIHLGSSGVKLVLDSDMLFFRRPDALLAWWDSAVDASQQVSGSRTQSSDLGGRNDPGPSSQLSTTPSFSPCLMTDCVESYGYSRALMEELAGVPIPPLLNVGICGLKSEDIDWQQIEYWCRVLVEREGTSYFLEQALVAMLAARTHPVVMPREKYITFPTREETRNRNGILQHYVADSKPWYFGEAWKWARDSV
jgi:hypothetical protein